MTQLFAPVDGVQVHASTLLPVGLDFLVAWFAGSHEGAANSTVQIFSSRDGLVRAVAPEDPQPHWNPVLAHGPDGHVWLFFKRGLRIDEWTTWVCHSADDGRTWSAPTELAPGDRSGGRGPTRQAPMMVDGLWLAPGSVEVWDPPRWDSFIDISDDAGRTWERVELPLRHAIRGAGCIQPCLVQLPDGELVVLTRSTAGAVFRSATRDPRRWPALEPTSLPNNNSGIAAVVLPDGRIVCCHNDATEDWGSRSRLLLSVSGDGGVTWEGAGVIIDGGDGAAGEVASGAPVGAAATGVVTSGEGEYSYPCLQVIGDELWTTYTWQRRSIALDRRPLADLSRRSHS